jgi:glycosyltransferase involved in cell wall biosynthesis
MDKMAQNAAAGSLQYVLITPARNEEAFIEKTIQSVISQTSLPAAWVIVSDGSADRTDEIVKSYAAQYRWIKYIRLPEHRDRSFAAKVQAFNAGHELVAGMDYAIIGNLDADISFDPEYLSFIMAKFREIQGLGVAGTPFCENGYSSSTDSFEGERHVAGGCQLFRKECFEDIGGYTPVREGVDWLAVTTARMKGWETRSFKEKMFQHYRPLGTGESNSVAALFRYGKKDYLLGGHPLWEVFRVLYRILKKPIIWGGLVILAGYLAAALRGERYVSAELMRFHRQEQMGKLGLILKSLVTLRKIDKYHLRSLIITVVISFV